MAESNQTRGSMLLVDEYFNSQDERFVDELRRVRNPKPLAGFVDRWKRDPRPWAREQMLKYLQLPFDVVGHQPVVKRLFKHAESAQLDDVMAVLLVACDRLVRRERKIRKQYDFNSRQTWEEEILHMPRNTLPSQDSRNYRNPRTGEEFEIPLGVPRNGRLFRYRTRYYLRRRAWRYFRRMGYQRPQEYPAAIARALQQYRDADLSQGQHVLESWSLLESCFRHCPALHFGARRIQLSEGRTLGELKPAPRFLELWQKAESLPILLGLVMRSESRFVRVWAMDMIRQEHLQRLVESDVAQLLRLLEHSDTEVQQFGVDMLKLSPSLSSLSVDVWLRLMTVQDATVQSTICDLMKANVGPERFSLQQSVQLACSPATAVARLGFDFVQQSFRRTPGADSQRSADRQTIARLADAKCVAMANEVARWALAIVGDSSHYDRECVIAFFDSQVPEMRDGAWDWLTSNSPASRDPQFFSRLVESPYDDIRLRLVDELQAKSRIGATNGTDLTPIWSTVLLGVHRGGRQKVKATRQLVEAIVVRPERSEELLPVLAIAVRSVRPTEWRAGLSALMQLAERQPEVTRWINQNLPEVKLLEPPSWT